MADRAAVDANKSRLTGERIAQDLSHGVEDRDDARLGEVVDDRRAVANRHDEMALAQDLQVAGGGWLRQVEVGGQLAHVARPLVEGVEDAQSLRVAQRLADACVQQVEFFDRRPFHRSLPCIRIAGYMVSLRPPPRELQ